MFLTDKKITCILKCTNGKLYGCVWTGRNKAVSLYQANMVTAVSTRADLVKFKYISNAYIQCSYFAPPKKKHQESFELLLADINPVHLLIRVKTVETAALNDASVHLL